MINQEALIKSQAFINGQWISPIHGHSFPVLNPFDQSLIADVADCGVLELNLAIDSAETAFEVWRKTPAHIRANFLHEWRQQILAHADELASLLTREQGKTLAQAKAEVDNAAEYLSFFAEEARRIHGETVAFPDEGRRCFSIKQPIGVSAAITPWNYPISLCIKNAVPAMAAGCTVVLKPAQDTPLCALALAELANRAGIPHGVFNVIPCFDPTEVGSVLCEHPAVRRIAFTGSTTVGKKLMQRSSAQLKRLCLELGGNAPFIIFEDADIQKAISDAIHLKLINSGQVCINGNRFYIHNSIYDQVVEELAARAKTVTVGSGMDSSVQMGPLINQAGFAKVQRLINDAVSKGAEIVAGGALAIENSLCFQLTVLSEMTDAMDMHDEEIFGPVIACYRFDSEEQVLKMANDTDKGLAAYFYSRDAGRVWRVSETLEAGLIGANTISPMLPTTPFGGMKQSGLGRIGGVSGALDSCCEIKTIGVGGL